MSVSHIKMSVHLGLRTSVRHRRVRCEVCRVSEENRVLADFVAAAHPCVRAVQGGRLADWRQVAQMFPSEI
jgi:hypothetical protein